MTGAEKRLASILRALRRKAGGGAGQQRGGEAKGKGAREAFVPSERQGSPKGGPFIRLLSRTACDSVYKSFRAVGQVEIVLTWRGVSVTILMCSGSARSSEWRGGSNEAGAAHGTGRDGTR